MDSEKFSLIFCITVRLVFTKSCFAVEFYPRHVHSFTGDILFSYTKVPQTVEQCMRMCRQVLGCNGFNIRWSDDTNTRGSCDFFKTADFDDYVQNPHASVYFKDCRLTTKGLEYRGRQSITRSGRVCQSWASQSPHGHNRDDVSSFPGAAHNEGNTCRNPDGEPGLWCYTLDPGTRWEYCDVPEC